MKKRKGIKPLNVLLLVVLILGLFILTIASVYIVIRLDEGSTNYVEKIDEIKATLRDFVNSPDFVKLVVEAGSKNSTLTKSAILRIDKEWQTSGDDYSLKAQLLTNAIAKEIAKFQREYPFFIELIVTDSSGINIGMTNITTDFYQADEEWWKVAYNKGKGKAFVGRVTFDESSGVWGIPIMCPIISNGKVVGVVKGIVVASKFY